MPSVKIHDLRTRKTLFESLMNETKDSIVSSSSSIKRAKTCSVLEGGDAVGWNFPFFLEREHLLCRIPVDRTVGFDGARRKVVLHGEGYAWTPIWWSSDNSKR